MRVVSQLVDWISAPYTMYLILKDPAVPWPAKVRGLLVLVLVFAYILSPVDLIPDVVPFSGWVDDMVVAPLALFLANKTVPDIGISAKRGKAESRVRRIILLVVVSMVAVIALSLGVLVGVIYLVVRLVGG